MGRGYGPHAGWEQFASLGHRLPCHTRESRGVGGANPARRTNLHGTSDDVVLEDEEGMIRMDCPSIVSGASRRHSFGCRLSMGTRNTRKRSTG